MPEKSLLRSSIQETDCVKFICMVPVRNEAWILPFFLAQAASWADEIIVLDQQSSDGSLEIARAAPKTRSISNDTGRYNEAERQLRLIEEARRLNGRRVLFALDADEFLRPGFPSPSERQAIADADPGTAIEMPWVDILPGGGRSVSSGTARFGYVDDGSPHDPSEIHSSRVPSPPLGKVLNLDAATMFHLQYFNWDRQLRKQRWYQCYEVLERGRNSVDVFRQYNRFRELLDNPGQAIVDFDIKILAAIPLATKSTTWWDCAIIDWLRRHGGEDMGTLDIWDVDWNETASACGGDPLELKGRRLKDRVIVALLRSTQSRRKMLLTRLLDRLLRAVVTV